ncbi:MAG: VOC family protein [Actinomycetota bacterium]
MAVDFKVVLDCSRPQAQASFWAQAMGYLVEDHSALIEQLLTAGALPEQATVEVDGRRAFADLAAVRHPDDPYDERSGAGSGRRILFQRVPEPKTVKNRVHLDLHYGTDKIGAEAERLVAIGATVLGRFSEQGSTWITLADPEGNEFDLA